MREKLFPSVSFMLIKMSHFLKRKSDPRQITSKVDLRALSLLMSPLRVPSWVVGLISHDWLFLLRILLVTLTSEWFPGPTGFQEGMELKMESQEVEIPQPSAPSSHHPPHSLLSFLLHGSRTDGSLEPEQVAVGLVFQRNLHTGPYNLRQPPPHLAPIDISYQAENNLKVHFAVSKFILC